MEIKPFSLSLRQRPTPAISEPDKKPAAPAEKPVETDGGLGRADILRKASKEDVAAIAQELGRFQTYDARGGVRSLAGEGKALADELNSAEGGPPALAAVEAPGSGGPTPQFSSTPEERRDGSKRGRGE